MASCLMTLYCCCSAAGDGISRLLASSTGTLLLLSFPGPLTGIWATQRHLQLAQIICSGSNPCLGCGTLHMAWNKTWVPPQAEDTPYHLVTQAVACSNQPHMTTKVDILCTKTRLHTHAKLLTGNGTQVLKCSRYVRSGYKQNVGRSAFCSVECAPATDYVCHDLWLVGIKHVSAGTAVVTLNCDSSQSFLTKKCYTVITKVATNTHHIHKHLLTQAILHKFCLSIQLTTLKNVLIAKKLPSSGTPFFHYSYHNL
jgi:hypothetical protein